ncbi:DUF4112 domain-containing protein [Marinobacter halodurans]|uniref:DUF4112 domain-containing protein n=1 Tax=Marinobacter halodurans TaxID=2528979 RepID=A0ABY1ZID8_9GAMM|nr:DUF4112 domain-containing protein [Marinobacter halodurans]TBW54288.1 DUF4112 domain-containing protein [Marinobacter halodurans]
MPDQTPSNAPPGPQEREKLENALARLESSARLLDSQFRIPFTRIRFGLDPLMGLLPGIGDAAGLVLSLYLMVEAVRLGAGTRQVARMAGNVLLEFVIGIVPIVGDLFDFAWKANDRNAALLRRHIEKRLDPPPRRRPWIQYTLIAVFGAMLLFLLVMIWRALFVASGA